MRYVLEISYIGTKYHGWQIQNNAITIQKEIEKALSLIFLEKISINGSSRTDSGVHARQQFAHFDSNKLISKPETEIKRINNLLPKDIAINAFFKVTNDIHTRFDAINRKYIYRISNKKDPFNEQITAVYYQQFDIQKMNEAAQLLMHYTDFECFSKVKTDVKTFNCEIENAFWVQNGAILEFHIKANRFLRGMVRAIVGTLLDVGKNKIDLKEFTDILKSKNRNAAGNAAKAEGLTLEEVNYPENHFELNFEISKAKNHEMGEVKNLFIKYQNFLNFSLTFQGFEKELESLPYPYSEPNGLILLAKVKNKSVGVVALKKLEDGICEIKRLFVLHEFNGLGIGQKLMDNIMFEAIKLDYKIVKLDTLARLTKAVKMYEKMGFQKTEPYNINPEEDILYFEKQL